MSAREHLRPQYAKTFRCIGSECEDTCCRGFAVAIDLATYQRYERSPKFQPLLKTHFVAIAPHPTEAAYARIQLTPEFKCPFLTAERLCGIQQEHGSDYLSEMCLSYPRASRRIDGLIQPGAAGGRSPYDQFLQTSGGAVRTNGSPHQFLWEIRGFTLLLIRERSYPIWQRLFILGVLCKRLNEIIDRHENALIPQLLQNFAQLIVEGRLRSMMDGIPETGSQSALVMEVIRRHRAIQTGEPALERFPECVQDFLKGIGYEDSSSPELGMRKLAEARRMYYEPFMQAHPFILENYLANHVFKTRFPFGVNARGEPNNPQTEFLMMSVLYAGVNGLLTGMAGFYREEFGTAHVVKLGQSFSKAVEHCPEFLEKLNPELTSANGMARVLKG